MVEKLENAYSREEVDELLEPMKAQLTTLEASAGILRSEIKALEASVKLLSDRTLRE